MRSLAPAEPQSDTRRWVALALLCTAFFMVILDVAVVNVDADPALERRYGEKVPVLAHGENELCHYRLDPAAVTAYLSKFR